MMAIVCRAGLTDVELASLQIAVSFALPEAYKQFLKRMNGLYLTDPDFAQLPLSSVEAGVISFDRLFGVNSKEECNDLIAFNQELIPELSFVHGALAIGEDGGGNPYVIITGAHGEGIYYWDRTHLHESDSVNNPDISEQEDCGHLYKVTDGFDEFYSMIMGCLSSQVELVQED